MIIFPDFLSTIKYENVKKIVISCNYIKKVIKLKLIQMKEGFELTGQNVQGYTISKPIGQGKFSIVYKA